jgi:16S rRNA (uracil1498-N3)-methyltransferase
MQQPRAGVQLIAHCQPGPKEWLDAVVAPGLPVTILIGPEGDFSDTEIALALANNYRPITLGSGRLRTETAGVVACHSVSWIFRST